MISDIVFGWLWLPQYREDTDPNLMLGLGPNKHILLVSATNGVQLLLSSELSCSNHVLIIVTFSCGSYIHFALAVLLLVTHVWLLQRSLDTTVLLRVLGLPLPIYIETWFREQTGYGYKIELYMCPCQPVVTQSPSSIKATQVTLSSCFYLGSRS